jgi:GH35 family endo-1,4-beta-xylanase
MALSRHRFHKKITREQRSQIIEYLIQQLKNNGHAIDMPHLQSVITMTYTRIEACTGNSSNI